MHISVTNETGQVILVELKEWSSIKDLKDRLFILDGIPADQQRVFLGGKELSNSWWLSEVEEGAVLYIKQKGLEGGCDREGVSLEIYGDTILSNEFIGIMQKLYNGLNRGLKPQLTLEGTGGTYLLRDGHRRQPAAVFKPCDEEPGAVNNPRDLQSTLGQDTGLRLGIRPGEGQHREVAASLLDHDGFAGVSRTVLAELCHPALCYRNSAPVPKLGSLQAFIAHDDAVSDLSPSLFPVEEVHKIALLDMRLMNTDRNDGNILARRTRRLAPRSVIGVPPSPRGIVPMAAAASSSGVAALSHLAALRSEDSDSDCGSDYDSDRGRSGGSSTSTCSSSSSESSSEGEEERGLFARGAVAAASGAAAASDEDGFDWEVEEPEEWVTHTELFPIDHSYCLPDRAEVAWCDWCWLDWPQMKQPLSEEMTQYIARLDPQEDAHTLRSRLSIREPCVRLMIACTRFLQKATAAAAAQAATNHSPPISLFDIASVMCRQDLDTPSELELVMTNAHSLALSTVQNLRLRAALPVRPRAQRAISEGDGGGSPHRPSMRRENSALAAIATPRSSASSSSSSNNSDSADVSPTHRASDAQPPRRPAPAGVVTTVTGAQLRPPPQVASTTAHARCRSNSDGLLYAAPAQEVAAVVASAVDSALPYSSAPSQPTRAELPSTAHASAAAAATEAARDATASAATAPATGSSSPNSPRERASTLLPPASPPMSTASPKRYIPPHVRRRMAQEREQALQQQQQPPPPQQPPSPPTPGSAQGSAEPVPSTASALPALREGRTWEDPSPGSHSSSSSSSSASPGAGGGDGSGGGDAEGGVGGAQAVAVAVLDTEEVLRQALQRSAVSVLTHDAATNTLGAGAGAGGDLGDLATFASTADSGSNGGVGSGAPEWRMTEVVEVAVAAAPRGVCSDDEGGDDGGDGERGDNRLGFGFGLGIGGIRSSPERSPRRFYRPPGSTPAPPPPLDLCQGGADAAAGSQATMGCAEFKAGEEAERRPTSSPSGPSVATPTARADAASGVVRTPQGRATAEACSRVIPEHRPHPAAFSGSITPQSSRHCLLDRGLKLTTPTFPSSQPVSPVLSTQGSAKQSLDAPSLTRVASCPRGIQKLQTLPTKSNPSANLFFQEYFMKYMDQLLDRMTKRLLQRHSGPQREGAFST